eukprot:COSAG01_NODE_66028_length_271_cov_0.906977_1_plen_26_part_01
MSGVRRRSGGTVAATTGAMSGQPLGF